MGEHLAKATEQTTTPAAADVPSLSARESDNIYTDCLQRLPLQRKLSVGAIDDPMEHEADAMADQVMRMPESSAQNLTLQRALLPGSSFIQKKCAHCEEEDLQARRKPQPGTGQGLGTASFIQAKRNLIQARGNPIQARGSDGPQSTASETLTSQIRSTQGGGSPLPETTRRFMESRFGADFSNVRLHTGGDAAQLSGELNAQAFTVGSDIYFNEGKYSPESSAGKHLLAHELTHTLQQGGWPGGGGIHRKENIIRLKDDPKPISEIKTVDVNGKKIEVERVVTPGECKLVRDSTSSASGDFRNNKILFEAKGCKNNVTGEAYGDLDFNEFVTGANNLLKSVPGIIGGGGNASEQFSKEFDKNFKSAKLRADLRFVLKFNLVRIEVKGTGGVNLDEKGDVGASGFIRYANGKLNFEFGAGFTKQFDQLKNPEEITFHLYSDIGPIIIRIDGKHSNATTTVEGKIFDPGITKLFGPGLKYEDINGEKKLTLTLTFTIPEKIPTEKAPDCYYCPCESPTTAFLCKDVTPPDPGKTKPPDIPDLQTKYVSLFYKYAMAEPRDDKEYAKEEYENTIKSIIQDIEKGYTIDHIEGYTSPEGPLNPVVPARPGGFEGNIELSKERAKRASDDIKKAVGSELSKFIFTLSMREPDPRKSLNAVNNSNITIIGKNEVHGSGDQSPDIPDQKLFEHLEKELKAPAPGEQDILEQEHITGESLPAGLRDRAEKDITSFRTGADDKKKLTRGQRLQRLYPWLRKALVILKPPATPAFPSTGKLPDLSIKDKYITCTDEHTKVFANSPMPPDKKLFIDHCSTKPEKTEEKKDPAAGTASEKKK